MFQILAQVHYMPDAWKIHANSYEVRDEFVKLFQYKFVNYHFCLLIHKSKGFLAKRNSLV